MGLRGEDACSWIWTAPRVIARAWAPSTTTTSRRPSCRVGARSKLARTCSSSQRFRHEDAVVEALGPFDDIYTMREMLTYSRALLTWLPRLRLIVATAESNRRIDFSAAETCGVEVVGTPNGDYGRVATAELTWGLILSAAHNIVAEDRFVREGRWQA
jgi:lactate dehydrogenase-like 2-hydroxyacid dehydrogenase